MVQGKLVEISSLPHRLKQIDVLESRVQEVKEDTSQYGL
jgi:hypothetical protein